MSWINQTLIEEKERTLRFIDACEEEIAKLPKGYISVKNIRGVKTFYLQWRDGTKIRSKYIKSEQVEEITKQIQKRKKGNTNLKNISEI